MKRIISLLTFIILLVSVNLQAQDIYINPNNTAIYDFIDELANDGIIEINSVVKPYSRKQVYKYLIEARSYDKLSNRQKEEIEFYLKEFQIESESSENPYKDSKLNLSKKWSENAALQLDQLGFFYKDNLFTVSAKPIWGIDRMTNESGTVTHFWGGARAYASIGKHWAFYANLRDNSESELLSQPYFFNQHEGGNYKIGEGGRPGGDYSEMRGGLVYSWNWGDVALIKDHIQWGDNYHGSNILSGRTPSYAMIKLHIKPAKWFEFNYHHGWLVSEVTDSSRSYYTADGFYRTQMREKYIAANMFTLIPWSGVNFSFGNSIIYSDLGGPHPAYLVPFMFFKSIDHTLNHNVENQNSQLFLNLSIRKIKHLHLYGSLFVDEFSKTRIGVDTLHNFLSYKGGFKINNLLLKNYAFTLEYTYTYPMTFKHRVQTTTFESNKYNLGHYLGDNSRELYMALQLKPLKKLRLKIDYCIAQHGNDYAYKHQQGIRVDAMPVLKEISWESKTLGFSAEYEVLNDVFLKAYLIKSSVSSQDLDGFTAANYLKRFGPEFYWGDKTTLGVGLNMGF